MWNFYKMALIVRSTREKFHKGAFCDRSVTSLAALHSPYGNKRAILVTIPLFEYIG